MFLKHDMVMSFLFTNTKWMIKKWSFYLGITQDVSQYDLGVMGQKDKL